MISTEETARPFSTFDGKELYSNTVGKASAILESMAINHPFIDGNKGQHITLMRLLLLENNLDIAAAQEEKFQLVISVTTGKL